MLGTWVNVGAIILGSLLGLKLSHAFKASTQNAIMNALGLIVIIIGIDGALKTENMMLVIISLVLGTLIGIAFKIEDKLDTLGNLLEKKMKSSDSNISAAFIQTTLIYCVGAMAIVGALESGITGNHNTLYAKSMIDGISSIIFASTLGIGVIFSSISVFIYQGSMTLFSGLIAPLLSDSLILEISAIGGVLIFAIGLNMLEIKKISIANMLPSMLIPIIYYLMQALF